ncbi:hypothetical protein BO71DRAFT_177453 [Aspergillus ellipticus CBS 707.79]|uniref:Uncharacterized protein n=1 Tax=Aspergillus ellipticus CBS 707.79 TaxID=1448320 RepID=A0A319DHI5_9EURO|nr:hypothetical protein BO71DRAFT_177453 [Aspergillus ellipticus CBS 707.79]
MGNGHGHASLHRVCSARQRCNPWAALPPIPSPRPADGNDWNSACPARLSWPHFCPADDVRPARPIAASQRGRRKIALSDVSDVLPILKRPAWLLGLRTQRSGLRTTHLNLGLDRSLGIVQYYCVEMLRSTTYPPGRTQGGNQSSKPPKLPVSREHTKRCIQKAGQLAACGRAAI